jgi:hypothetical protein
VLPEARAEDALQQALLSAELHKAVRIADAGDDELERRAVMRQTLASLAALPERQREALSVRAAATALTPMPLVTAAASGSSRGGSLVGRISELVAGGGASLTLAKAGTVAVLAGQRHLRPGDRPPRQRPAR